MNLPPLELNQPSSLLIAQTPQQPVTPPPSLFQQNYPSHFHQPPIGSIVVPVVPNLMPNNGDLSSISTLQNPAVGSAVTQTTTVPTSPTGPPPPFPPIISSSVVNATQQPTVILSTNSIQAPSQITQPPLQQTIPSRPIHNNDLNDAQNISKILQSSFHNGTSSTINSTSNNSSTLSNNLNHNSSSSNNSANDKRLFIDESEPKTISNNNNNNSSNSKEDRLSNDKNHSRSKKKPTPTKNKQEKESKHAHTNGLIEKKSNHKSNNSTSNNSISSSKSNNNNNRNSIVNGDDGIEEEIMDKFKDENVETRSLVFREIRKYGRDYSGLYEQLNKIKGTFDMRFNFIQMCIDEASRFRRKHMADCIQDWWSTNCDGTASITTATNSTNNSISNSVEKKEKVEKVSKRKV
jgi:hypothetical protein